MRFLNDDRVVDKGNGSPPMQVIAAGLPRCATSSLQAALESPILGMGPSMHMAHVFPNPNIGELVIAAMREANREKRQKILHLVFDGYASTTDFPGIMFIDDLMDMYPEAAIILNQRKSAKEWSDSFGNSLAWFGSWSYRLLGLPFQTGRTHFTLQDVASRTLTKRYGEPGVSGESFYHKHNEWVRAEAQKRGRKVLEFQPGMGYGALCEFLGKEKPKEAVDFPRLNDARTIRILKAILIARGVMAWAALGGILWASWKYGPDLLQWGVELARRRV